MTSDVPGSGQPDPAEPPAPPDASPTEVVPTAPPAAAPAPMPAEPAAPAPPSWGAAPGTPPSEAAPVPAEPPVASSEPPAGQPPGGQPPSQPGQWGAPPPQQPAGWGPAPAPGASQPPGWAPAPGAPGGVPPSGTWSPAPATSSGNGCLKGCIIVAIILVVVVVIGFAALFIFARQFVSDLGVNPDTGNVKECSLVTNDELNAIFGGTDAQALPMGGIADVTIGQVLDNRVLGDAPDCWIVASGTSVAVTGRIAAQDGLNASGDFQAAKSAAQAGKYFGGDVTGFGEEAFCTGASAAGSFGILVRSGGRLAYVSLLDPRSGAIGDWETTDDGVTISPDTCKLAGEIAAAVFK